MQSVTDVPTITYLSFDSLQEGVGASQVLRYVERLAERGLAVRLHSFERQPPPPELTDRVKDRKIEWMTHPFGGQGSRHGASRVVRAAAFVRGAELLHARSDLAAATALLARPRRWLWDMRSLWAEERIVMGTLRRGSPEHRALNAVTARAGRNCDALIALSHSARDVIRELYGAEAERKTRVVTTCVDLDRFVPRPLMLEKPVRLLLSGTLNPYYDLPLTVAFLDRLKGRCPATLEVASPDGNIAPILKDATSKVFSASPDEMPDVVATSHVGLSICRLDAGISLKARMPTKIGEFLATGRPVVVNPGLGDMDRFILDHRCGVVVRGPGRDDLENAVTELIELLEDPETPSRCRAVAELHFNVETGTETLIQTYRDISSGGS